MPFAVPKLPWKSALLLLAAFLALAALAALAIGLLRVATGSYDGRNGAAEAMDDIRTGLPLKFYTHMNNQIGPGMRTPGVDCPGSSGTSAFWKIRRVVIDEAAFNEGATLTRSQWRKVQAARAFAYLYNTTMFDAHQSALKRACPGIVLQPFSPELRLERVE